MAAVRTSHRLLPGTLSACLASALGIGSIGVLPSQPAFAAHPDAEKGLATARYQRRLELRRQRDAGPAIRASTLDPASVAATRPVTSCADDSTPGTLRNVIYAADDGDTIDMSALTCSTITLTQGEIDISVLGDHQINNLTLVGPGRGALTIDANNARFLNHGDFQVGLGQLVLRDLTITNGNYTHGLASCIDSSGDVTLTRVTISDCHASNGGPLTFGGAVSVSGDLSMIESSISGSSSSAGGDNVAIGGGAYVANTLTLVDSTISGNTVTSVSAGDGANYITAGGGVYARGELSATRSTITGNSAQATGAGENAIGAGVFVRDQTAVVSSTIDSNTADGRGGGLFKAVFSVYGDPGTSLSVSNSTISGNSASSGAGIASSRPLTLANSTVTANTASDGGAGVLFALDSSPNPTFTLQSSIIAGNVNGPSATLPADLAATGPMTVLGADNLIVAAGTLPLPADTLSVDPQLLALADNGGPTPTHALATASPAREVGNNAAALMFDQRGSGHPRVVGAAADIGAYEWQSDAIFRDGFDVPVTYLRDDGSANTNQGPPGSFNPDMLWGNYFITEVGGVVITQISVAFGPTFPSLANGPVTFWLLNDADADGDPRNARLLVSTDATPDVSGNTFFNVAIPPTRVSGAFFVGASAKLIGGADRPARVDTSSPGDNSWFFYAPDIATVINNLASAPFGSQNIAPTNPLPGAFMVRASATGP